MKDASIFDDEFIANVRGDMLKFARIQLRDASQAEDAVQEALAAAFTGERSFAGRAALKTWIFAILRHKIVDLLRQGARSINVSALAADEEHMDATFDSLFGSTEHWRAECRPAAFNEPEESLRQQHFWDVFEICLNHLPENTSRVFMMREFLEFETTEVCAQLGLTINNCNVILYRARNSLRRCLETSWFVPGERPC